MQLASIRLRHPIVNLVKVESGHWNQAAAHASAGGALPALKSGRPYQFQIRRHQIHFYIDNVDLDAVRDRTEARTGTCGFSGPPARPGRTQRPAERDRQPMAARPGGRRYRARENLSSHGADLRARRQFTAPSPRACNAAGAISDIRSREACNSGSASFRTRCP